MMLAIDTETTGLDLRHGAKPFMVQLCDDTGNQTWFEWDVDPLTREPQIPATDVGEIAEMIEEHDCLVLQNPKFDVAALFAVGIGLFLTEGWPWFKTYDTLLAGHLLKSDERHDLSTMALVYCNIDIDRYAKAIEAATKDARKWAKKNKPDWRTAKVGLPEMPSVKETTWKYDMWLPRVVAKEESYPWTSNNEHPWFSVASDYGNGDSLATLKLFIEQKRLLKKRKLWQIYLERLKVLPIVYKMEDYGVTLSRNRLGEQTEEYSKESEKLGRICVNIAKSYGHELELPKSGNNKSLLEFVFDVMKLPVTKKSQKTGKPSMDREVLDGYLAALPKKSKSLLFVNSLLAKRSRDTALNYIEGYRRFWLPCYKHPRGKQIWYRLHPSLNPTGTHTLRWSSSNPNEQNISKKEGFNLRYAFGPAPGREWWSIDAKNIELRIPAYEAGETEQIELFEKPNEAPYFGSNHLLVFDILHTERLMLDTSDPKYLLKAKKKYESTWYQWTKNGNFAVQYGAMEASGTADTAYHLDGAQHIVQGRFRKAKRLNATCIKMANECGYIETMPDKTVDPERGYPLYCRPGKWGKVSPTIPLNYHVQGTAMWWMQSAMIRVQEYLDELNATIGVSDPPVTNPLRDNKKVRVTNSRVCPFSNRGYFMVMQVHDEIVFDFPAGKDIAGAPGPHFENLSKIRKIAKLMEKGGDDIGLPTPVSIEYHSQNWSEGVSVS